MSDDRLQALLQDLSPPPPPHVACALHAPLYREDGALSPAELDALDDTLDCPDCIATLEAHPYLDPDVLDLPLPPPRLPSVATLQPANTPWPRWPATAMLVLAAAAVLFTLRPAPQPDLRPGPTKEGASGYAWVEPVTEGPQREGREQYPTATPSLPEAFRFTSIHELPSDRPPFTGLHEG